MPELKIELPSALERICERFQITEEQFLNELLLLVSESEDLALQVATRAANRPERS